MQQVFDIKGHPGSRLLGFFKLGVEFPGKISPPEWELTSISAFARR